MKNKGITLVALVITIVILLILAAISIQALKNQGLFGRANEAKEKSEIANIKEQIALDIYEKQLEPPLGSITDEQLETILGKYGTVNKEDGTIVGITTAKGYEILLKDIYGGETVAESVPDGALVTPINNITTWLKTGGISNQYSYTTIEQVITDSTCTQSLMNNENAMKYLARSTEFADAICASETAMTYLGQSTYVDDTVLNSDTWSTAICNSTYFELVLKDKIPIMTSNTEPYGEVKVSSKESSNFNEYKAFGGTVSDGYDRWSSAVNTLGYIQYKFVNPTNVKKVKFYIRDIEATFDPALDCTAEILASNTGNDGDWEYLLSLNISETEVKQENYYNIDNNKHYLYYRFNFTSFPYYNDSKKFCGMKELQFYGRSKQ